MSVPTDIIVIGAGIAGASAAAALADTASIIVLEQESHPGYHATGRSAATWAPFYGPPAIQQLTALSEQTLCSPPAHLHAKPFTSALGEMMLGTTKDIEALEEQKALGMQEINFEEALQMVPLLRREAVDTVLYTDTLLRVDVDALHQAWLKKTKAAGGLIVSSAKAQTISHDGHGWTVATSQQHYTAPVVINAAGAWADEIASMAGVDTIGMQPRRRSAALVPYAKNANMKNWPMIFGAGETFYATSFSNGMMISPADETLVEPHDAWPDDTDLATGIDQFQSVISYDVPRITHSWAGLRTFAPDGVPVIGFDAKAPGFFWLAGQGGYGIQTSPAIATLCARLVNASRSGISTPAGFVAPQDCDRLDRLASQLSPTRRMPA